MWAGKECVIPALFVELGSSATKDIAGGKEVLPVPVKDSDVYLVHMTYIPDDDAKVTDAKEGSK